MTPNEIRAEIIRRGISLTNLAKEAKCTLPQLSMCIGGSRIYPRLRLVVAKRLGKKVDRVFGRHHPQPQRGRERREMKRAA